MTNNGNVPDVPTLHNHTKKGGEWDPTPGLNELAGWASADGTDQAVEFAIVDGFETEYPLEIACLTVVSGETPPVYECYYDEFTGTWYFPPMPAYTTIQIVAIINVGNEAALGDQSMGIKALSEFGDAFAGGDHDETPEWADSCSIDSDNDGLPDNDIGCDTNEQILHLRLRAPDLIFVGDASIGDTSKEVGEMIPVTVQIQNIGNVHATDVNIILCVGEEDEIKETVVVRKNIVYRRVIGALMPTSPEASSEAPEITLLYPVTAGSEQVVVVIDPEKTIVESSDDNNYLDIQEDLQSENPIMDVALVVVSKWSVPTIIMAATAGLIGVAGLMMLSRRKEALDRVAEQSSILQGVDEDARF